MPFDLAEAMLNSADDDVRNLAFIGLLKGGGLPGSVSPSHSSVRRHNVSWIGMIRMARPKCSFSRRTRRRRVD